jgi:hypothetical protein
VKKKWLIIVVAAFLVVSSPILFRKRTVAIASAGRLVAVAKRPILPAWNDSAVDVYVGKDKVFSLWEDAFDSPLFIYPFSHDQRFLCVYDFDVSMLVFVVDLDASATNKLGSPDWPADERLRSNLAQGATNVVLETKGLVRLPTYAELQEVSGYLSRISSSELKATSFPFFDAGIYRHYASKDYLLLDVATNRQSMWPLKK